MPRLSSFRFLWSTARLGVVAFLLLSFAAVASAQPSSGGVSGGVSGGGPGGGMGGPASALGAANGMNGTIDGANGGALTTVSSEIKRSDVSSVVRVQALLYPDATFVARFNLGKIDYAGLNDFIGEIVDKGVGSVRSNDDYRVKLRDYQKSSIKSSFSKLLGAAQNAVSQRFYQNKIDDIYVVNYSENNACILAFPTDGLSESDQKTLVDAAEDAFKPFAIFNRFGFVVAVVASDGGNRFDVDSLKQKYVVRNAVERSQSAGFGGANGMNATFGSGASPAAGPGKETSNDAANGSRNELGISDALYREYQAELKAGDQIRADSRKQVLPYVRRRFEKAASAEDAAKFFDALKQTDGAAFAFVFNGANGLEKMSENVRAFAPTRPSFDANSAIAASFAETDDANAANEETAASPETDFNAALQSVEQNESLKNVQTLTLAVSLVGSPRVVAIAAFDSPEAATASAASIEKSTALVKPLVSGWALEFAKKNNVENADFSPLIDGLFNAMKPQIVGKKVATTLDFGVFKENADALLPFFGGVESQSDEAAAEAEEIDWNLGADEKATDANVEEADEETVEEPKADDANAEETAPQEPKTEPKEEPKTNDEDDPFA